MDGELKTPEKQSFGQPHKTWGDIGKASELLQTSSMKARISHMTTRIGLVRPLQTLWYLSFDHLICTYAFEPVVNGGFSRAIYVSARFAAGGCSVSGRVTLRVPATYTVVT